MDPGPAAREGNGSFPSISQGTTRAGAAGEVQIGDKSFSRPRSKRTSAAGRSEHFGQNDRAVYAPTRNLDRGRDSAGARVALYSAAGRESKAQSFDWAVVQGCRGRIHFFRSV